MCSAWHGVEETCLALPCKSRKDSNIGRRTKSTKGSVISGDATCPDAEFIYALTGRLDERELIGRRGRKTEV